MRIAYLGSGEFGVPTLRAIAERHALVGVVSQPDRPAGRGAKVTATPVSEWVSRGGGGVPMLKPEDVNEAAVVGEIRGWKPDALVVIAFGQRIGAGLLQSLPAINLHASVLPRWRGAAPINWAILGGDVRTGNSVISIAERMDAGLIYAQSEREIPRDATAGEMHDQLSADGPEVVVRVLDDLWAGSARGVVQDEALRTRAPKLSREMAVIDFAGEGGGGGAEECRRRINGLSPWPGVTVTFRGGALKLLRATTAPGGHAGTPGTIVDPLGGLVACAGGGLLQILEVQPPGKRLMSWSDYANGHLVKSQEVLIGGANPC